MESNVKTYELRDLASVRSSKRVKMADYVADGVPFFRSKEIIELAKGNKISTELFISNEHYDDIKSKYSVPLKGDILITSVGTLGVPYILPDNSPFYFKDGNLTWLSSFDVSKVFPPYIFYWLRSPIGKRRLDSIAIGTTQRALTITALNGLKIELPSITIQKKIVKIISSIENKITANTAMNQTLEKIAQRIFKSWFIDFDPVKANAEGVPFNGLSPEIQALFPSEFEESELGMIPKGWKILCTQDLFEVKDGTHDSPKKAEEGNYLVTSKHITNGKIDTSSAYLIGHADFEKINQRSKVDTFDILLTMIGTVGEIVVVHDNPVEFAIKNIGLFKTSQKPELVWLFYWYLQSSMMKNYLKVRMAGTTQQYLTLKTLRTIPIIVPSSDILNNFNNLVSPLMKKIASNHKQNDVLSAIQETLLPRLISGRILLSDVNQELKETE